MHMEASPTGKPGNLLVEMSQLVLKLQSSHEKNAIKSNRNKSEAGIFKEKKTVDKNEREVLTKCVETGLCGLKL